jgi:hypothetical protein
MGEAERNQNMVARVYPDSDLTTVRRSYIYYNFTIMVKVLDYNAEVNIVSKSSID